VQFQYGWRAIAVDPWLMVDCSTGFADKQLPLLIAHGALPYAGAVVAPRALPRAQASARMTKAPEPASGVIGLPTI
jgi:hypothetical protein